MHSNIVNGISYCAMLILCWNNVGELGLYLRYSLSCISPFSFCMFMFVTLTVLFLILSSSIVCIHNNLKRKADLVLWFPDKTSVYTYPWHQNDLIVFIVLLNLTKLNCSYTVLELQLLMILLIVDCAYIVFVKLFTVQTQLFMISTQWFEIHLFCLFFWRGEAE